MLYGEDCVFYAFQWEMSDKRFLKHYGRIE